MRLPIALALLASLAGAIAVGDTPGAHISWGGTGLQQATAAATDMQGNTWIAGWTDSPDFPVTNARFARGGGIDCFLIKLDSAGNVVLTSYLGGPGNDRATSLAVDAAGNVYMAGSTTSAALAGTPLSGLKGAPSGFVLKIDPARSSIVYARAVGGTLNSTVNSIFVTPDGRVFLAGATNSPDLPVHNASQATLRGSQNAFVAELDASGAVLYCTYLGGSGFDAGNAIAVDGSGAAWIAGSTTSSDFPTVAPFQPHLAGPQNAFVARVSSNGVVLFSTYLGGSGQGVASAEGANGIAIDAAGNAWIAGITSSSDFPLRNAWQSRFKGWDSDAFLCSFDTNGNLKYSTYLGGTEFDTAASVAVLPNGNIVVAGYTLSSDFPIAGGGQISLNTGYSAFVSEFNNAGTNLLYSAYPGSGEVLALAGGNPSTLAGATPANAGKTIAAVAYRVALPSTRPAYDFDGNGSPDPVWQDDISRGVVVWNMQGAQVQSQSWITSSAPGWTLRAVADMNGDGHPDLVWQSDSSRGVVVWYLQGTSVQSQSWITSAAPGWTLRAVVDMNGDGFPDLVWQSDSSRGVVVWYLQGTSVQSQSWITSAAPGWTLRTVVDMNGDGLPDLVWQNDSTRGVVVWYMKSVSIQSQSWLTDAAPGWTLQAVADMNGDGVPDLIWQNDSSRGVVVWYMQGIFVQSQSWLATAAPGWTLAAP